MFTNFTLKCSICSHYKSRQKKNNTYTIGTFVINRNNIFYIITLGLQISRSIICVHHYLEMMVVIRLATSCCYLI